MHATYCFPETFRFRHVIKGRVFEIKESCATENFPAGHYVRASARKAIPCTYSAFSGPHIKANSGVGYIPADLPVVQTTV